jgi:hypothetical protein
MHLARGLYVYVCAGVALLIGLEASAWAATDIEKRQTTDLEKRLALLNQIPPMEFLVAKGASNVCGPGCNSWIAAEGRIVPETPGRLRRLLDKLGNRNLPIFFASTGGKGYEALAMGRMLRKRKMTAGVARTVRADCLPVKSISECSKLLRDQPDAEAVLWTRNASCNSACAYAILGAAKREIAPDAFLGVHSAHFYVSVPGSTAAAQRRRDQVLRNDERRFEREVLRYLAEMDISSALYRLALQTQFEYVHVLTRAEMFELGIDRRESVEIGWHFGYQPVPAVGAAAFANIKASTVAKHLVLIISCNSRQPGNFTFTALQQLSDSSARPSTDLRVSAGGLGVTLTSASSYLTSDKNETFEVRQQGAARGMIEGLLGAPAVTVTQEAPADKGEHREPGEASATQYSIPGTGAADVLKTLVAYCTPTRQTSSEP